MAHKDQKKKTPAESIPMMPGYWVISKTRGFQKNANSSGFPKKFQANTAVLLESHPELQFRSLDQEVREQGQAKRWGPP